MTQEKIVRSLVDRDNLPDGFPTNEHEAVFWESLGRAVATFGYLEDVLGRAIFSFTFTSTRTYEEAEIEIAYEAWLSKMEHALIDTLGSLIDSCGKAVRDNPDARIEDLDELLGKLREASEMRNILCHGSWLLPDANGASIPNFVNRQMHRVVTPMDRAYIDEVQQVTANLVCDVMDTVTEMGWQFPRSSGPGKPIWRPDAQQGVAQNADKHHP